MIAQRVLTALGAVILLLATTAGGQSGHLAHAAAGDSISGLVFNDYNHNGARDPGSLATASDDGVAGVAVTAYAADGAAAGSAVTATDGSYTITTTAPGPWRVEFTALPAGHRSGPRGADSGTTTQFVPDGPATGVSTGVLVPSDYCQDNPRLAATCVVYGAAGTPAAPGPNALMDSLAGIEYGDAPTSGATHTDFGLGTAEHYAIFAATGATFGTAWDRDSNTLFQAAFMRNYSGFGSGGPGMIYTTTIDPATGVAGTTAPWLDVYSLPGVTACADPHGDDLVDATGPALVPAVFAAVGRCSLADIDLSPDGSTLYVVNLGDGTTAGQVLAIDVASGTLVAGSPWAVPTTAATTGRPLTDYHAGGLALHDGRLYVGVTDGADSTGLLSDVEIHVYRLDPTTGALDPAGPVVSQSMDYGHAGPDPDRQFHAWANHPTDVPGLIDDIAENVWHGTPWLTDIGIQGERVTLGLRDRFGDQGPVRAPEFDDGDGTTPDDLTIPSSEILCGRLSGATITLESGGVCPPGLVSNPANNDQGGIGGSEFFDDGTGGHRDSSFGGIAAIPGFTTVVHGAMNPAESLGDAEAYAGGLMYNNLGDGSPAAAFVLYFSGWSPPASPTFGKANGIGDVEALCQAAPIEIGNRVWIDQDGDGLQDPDEAGVAGVTVQLYAAGVQVGTTATAADGSFYFNRGNVIVGATPGIAPGADYEIRIPDGQAPLDDYALTVADAAGSDLPDSDAVAGPGYSLISVAASDIAAAGHNNHTFDAGFSPALYSIGNLIWRDLDNDGAVGTGESGIDGVVVALHADANGDGVPDGATPLTTRTTSSGGYFLFDGLAPGRYLVELPFSNFASGAPLHRWVSSTGNNGSAVGPVEPGVGDSKLLADDRRDHGTTRAGRVISTTITLGAAEPTGEPAIPGHSDAAPDAQSNYTIDFGLFPAAQIGDRVWHDLDRDGLQERGERSLPGITVVLLRDGVELARTVTDATGRYRFTHLAPGGGYSLRIDPPGAWRLTRSDVVSDRVDARDSDAAPGSRRTATTRLDARERDLTWDMGLFRPTTLSMRKSGAVTARAGAYIGYSITVSNRGPATARNVVVTDILPRGVVLSARGVLRAKRTPTLVRGVSNRPFRFLSGGRLRWNLGNIRPGARATITLRARVVRGASGRRTNRAVVRSSNAALTRSAQHTLVRPIPGAILPPVAG